MRVGLLTNSLALHETYGRTPAHGIALYILELVRAMLDEDPEIEFVLISERPTSAHRSLLADPRVKEACAPFKIKGMAKLGLWREWVMARERLDLLHEPEPSGGMLRLSRYPLVVTAHDAVPFLFPRTMLTAHGSAYRTLACRSITRADAIIASSENTREDLMRLFPGTGEKTYVVHLAPQTLDYDSLPDDELSDLREPYVLSVSTVEPRKNHLSLLDGYQMLREKGIDIRLVLTGRSGWKTSGVYEHEALERYGRDIIFTGAVSRNTLAYLYRHALVFIYPSLYEGFGMPPVEALGAGAPVVVGRNSCMSEVLGEAAYYLSPEPTGEEVASSVEEIMNNPEMRSRLSEEGRRRYGVYSWRKTAAQTLRIYRETLERWKC